MRYVFHPEALSEYAQAVQYYNEQRIELAQALVIIEVSKNLSD